MKKDLFYTCACSPEANGGLYLYRENVGGHVEQLAFAPLPGTNYLCYSPDGSRLYATWNEGKTGGIAAYRLNEDGSLVFLNRAESMGAAACHLTTSPDGRFLYCANYLTGNFAEFRLADDGAIDTRTQVVSHSAYPVGPRADRQECAHTHQTRFTPDGKFLCAVDLGTDRVLLYAFTPGKGIAVPPNEFVCAPGSGPRHLLFDASGVHAYLINELGNSVTACAYRDGRLTAGETFSTLPPDCRETTKASAVRLSPDGSFLYASNRGFDTIACFRVVRPGKLEMFDLVPAHGVSPRDINFLPSAKFFTASNEFSDRICFFAFNAENGKLDYLPGRDLALPRPLCIEF